MHRFVIFSLLLLSMITFFLGLNLGRQVEKADTLKTVAITKTVVTATLVPTKKTASPSAQSSMSATLAPTTSFAPTESIQ